ncbi:hypothetical protein EVA_11701 [gut metagenome]|uniref:Uncharacterized protein n=1 Tax=gut metagenome TaxID=749906 RepID=J9GEJ4_9ZZZZ
MVDEGLDVEGFVDDRASIPKIFAELVVDLILGVVNHNTFNLKSG